jgi:hypothetical protein
VPSPVRSSPAASGLTLVDAIHLTALSSYGSIATRGVPDSL